MAQDAATVGASNARVLPPGPPIPRDWQERYLEHVRQHGHYALAAKHAGICLETARRARHADPAFDQLCRDAREEAADQVEIDMLDSARRSDNPAGFIVRLKALRPQEYVEKHAIMNFSVSTELESADGLEALQMMFATMRPNTQALIQPRDARESGSAPPALAAPPATTESPA